MRIRGIGWWLRLVPYHLWMVKRRTAGIPDCTSEHFGPRMYCFYDEPNRCKYCGLPPAPITAEQRELIEAARHETWWQPPAAAASPSPR